MLDFSCIVTLLKRNVGKYFSKFFLALLSRCVAWKIYLDTIASHDLYLFIRISISKLNIFLNNILILAFFQIFVIIAVIWPI